MEPMDPGMDNPPHLGADGPDLPFGGPGFPDAFEEPEAPVVVEAAPDDAPVEPAPDPDADVDVDVVALPDLGEPVPVEPGPASTQFAHVPGAETFLTMTPEARTDELVSIAEGLGAADSVIDAIRDAAVEQHGMIFEALTTYDPMARSTFMSMVLEVPADDALFGGDEVELPVDDAGDGEAQPPMPPIVIDENQTDPPEGQHGPEEEPEKPLVGDGDGLGQTPLPAGQGQPVATAGETPVATPAVAAAPAAGGPPAAPAAAAAPAAGGPPAAPAAPADGTAPEVAAVTLTPPASDDLPAGPPALDGNGPDIPAPADGDAADPTEAPGLAPTGDLQPPSADFAGMPAAAAGGGEDGPSLNSQAAATVGRVLEAAAGAAGGAIAGAVAGVRAVTRNKADRDQAEPEKAPVKADEADPAAGADEAG